MTQKEASPGPFFFYHSAEYHETKSDRQRNGYLGEVMLIRDVVLAIPLKKSTKHGPFKIPGKTKKNHHLAFRLFTSVNLMPQASAQLHKGRGISDRACLPSRDSLQNKRLSSEQLWDFLNQEAIVSK